MGDYVGYDIAGVPAGTHLGLPSGTLTFIISIDFNRLAPRAFFGIPSGEFAHHSVDLASISRPLAAELHERVNAETEWFARFAAVDEVLMRTIDDAVRPRAEVVAAWRRIADSHGGLPVSLVADDVGWSRRHLGSQFRAEYGIGPKDDDVARLSVSSTPVDG